jgi:hypothetical protein
MITFQMRGRRCFFPILTHLLLTVLGGLEEIFELAHVRQRARFGAIMAPDLPSSLKPMGRPARDFSHGPKWESRELSGDRVPSGPSPPSQQPTGQPQRGRSRSQRRRSSYPEVDAAGVGPSGGYDDDPSQAWRTWTPAEKIQAKSCRLSKMCWGPHDRWSL